MVSVSVNGMMRSAWTDDDEKLAKRVAMKVLEGCGIPSTDHLSDGLVTTIRRRQCTDDERRKVVEKFLQV